MALVDTLRLIVDGRRKAAGLNTVICAPEELGELQAKLSGRVAVDLAVSSTSITDAREKVLYTTEQYSPGSIARAYALFCKYDGRFPYARQGQPFNSALAEVPAAPAYGVLEVPLAGTFWNVDVAGAYYTIYRATGLAAKVRQGALVPDGCELINADEWGAMKTERNALVGILAGNRLTLLKRVDGGELTSNLGPYRPQLMNQPLVRAMILTMHGLLLDLIDQGIDPLTWNVDGGMFRNAREARRAANAIEASGFATRVTKWKGWIGGPGSYDGWGERNTGDPPPLVRVPYRPSVAMQVEALKMLSDVSRLILR